jgi:transposase
MPRPFDNDLRRKLLAAHATGKGSQLELARSFGVSLGWVEKVLRQHMKTGKVDRVEQRHGPISRVDSATGATLLRAIEDSPDLTLAKLQRILAEQHGVRLSIGHVWNVLKRLDVRLKKSRSTFLSVVLRPIAEVGRTSLGATVRSPQNT